MGSQPSKPSPPDDLRPRGPGRQLWREVVDVYDMRPDEKVLLAEACRMVDELEAIRGKDDAHTKRQALRTELRRTLGQLGLPDDADEASKSDDPRTLAVLRAERESARSRRAQRAANARWERERGLS